MSILGRLFGKKSAQQNQPKSASGRVKKLVDTMLTGKSDANKAARAEFERLDPQERETAIPLIMQRFRAHPVEDVDHWYQRYTIPNALDAVGTLAAVEPLLEVLQSLKRTTIQDTGEFPGRYSEQDGAASSALVKIPSAVEKLKEICSPDEFERIIAVGYSYDGSYNNPELPRALCALATPRAIGVILTHVTRVPGPSERRKQAKEAFLAAGTRVQPALLGALEAHISDPYTRRERRKLLLEILQETGDAQCVPAITALAQPNSVVAEDARAALTAIAQRSPGITLPDFTTPRPIELKPVAPTGDAYVDSCFHLDFQEFADRRDWESIPEARAVPEAANSGKTDKALGLAQALRDKYPDFYFAYYWFAAIYQMQGRLDDARRAIREGLGASRRKHELCAQMGGIEWKAGDLKAAVPWWIKSIAIQTSTDHPDDDTPFLYLAYVAEGVGLKAACARIQKVQDSIGVGRRFNTQAANELYRATYNQGTAEVKRAIQLLDSEYLIPYLA